jgi:hypothetical protein
MCPYKKQTNSMRPSDLTGQFVDQTSAGYKEVVFARGGNNMEVVYKG